MSQLRENEILLQDKEFMLEETNKLLQEYDRQRLKKDSYLVNENDTNNDTLDDF